MNTYISSYTPGRIVIATAVALTCIVLVAISAAPASAQLWTEQDAGTTADFSAVDCPSMDVCYAGSESGGVLVKTTDGGDTWTSIGGPAASSISCPTELDCFAAAGSSISQTTDGGGSWSDTGWVSEGVHDLDCPTTDLCIAGLSRPGSNVMIAQGSNVRFSTLSYGHSGVQPDIRAVACPSALRCIAAGGYYAWYTEALPGIQAVGDHWAESLSNGITANYSMALSCPTELTCYGANMSGWIDVTRDGGLTWITENSGMLNGGTGTVACSRPTTCVLGGNFGAISQTTTGGAWVQTRNNDQLLTLSSDEVIQDLSCPVGLTCTAVGDDGLILSQGRASL